MVIELFGIFSQNLLGPIYAVFVKQIGGNFIDAGVALAINFSTVGMLTLFTSRLAQKYHNEKIQIILGYLLACLVAYIYTIITIPIHLFILQIFAGIAYSLYAPALNGLYSSTLSPDQHTLGWGNFLSMVYWVAAFSLVYSGFVSERFGFNALFYSMLAAQIFGALGAIILFVSSNH